MGLHDRPYMQEGGGDDGVHQRAITLGMPKPSRAIKWLLLINIAVFVLQLIFDEPGPGFGVGIMSGSLGVTVGGFWQVWRYITFQFLHGGFWHIVFNMLGLYFLGTPLERSWGTRRFLVFYLTCGVFAGIAFVIIGFVYRLNPSMPIIGASGGVFGIVLVCAVLFPQFRIIFLFFPVPIRLAALIIFGGMILLVLQSVRRGNMAGAMSDVAHLGGAVTAAFWIWALPKVRGARGSVRTRLRRGAWKRKMEKQADLQAELDRILAKIHQKGLNSLTDKERRALKEATHLQQQQDREMYRL